MVQVGEQLHSSSLLDFHQAVHGGSVRRLTKGIPTGGDHPGVCGNFRGGRLHPIGSGYQVGREAALIQTLRGALGGADITPSVMAVRDQGYGYTRLHQLA